MLGENIVFNTTKKKMMAKGDGVEVSYKEVEFGGQPARILDYKSGPQATTAYTAKAILLLVDKRMYTVTSAITKDSPENQALEEKMADTIQVH
jgi:hypothetical protein